MSFSMPLRRALFAAAAGAIFVLNASAQTARRPYVNATGRATVSATPDKVTVSATVTTQAPTAQEATSQNATRMTNLLTALRKLLGANGEIKTINLTVTPIYRSSQNQPPAIIAYSASNTVEVTLTVASAAGSVIDTATQNGATTVGSLVFGLRDPEPARTQALRLATQQAKAHADAMAAAMGRTVGNLLSIQESVTTVPVINAGRADTLTPATPVELGTLDVQATVVFEAELN
jgi:uncharacterized protein YggE